MFVKHPNKESIHIRTNTPTMSRDEGACKLSPICTRVVSTPSQGWGGGGSGLDSVTLRVLSQLTPSEDYWGLLTPVTFSVLIKMAVSYWNCPRPDISLGLCFKNIWIDAVRQLPGQDVPKQLSVWFRSPVHSNPPLAGAGFVQLL